MQQVPHGQYQTVLNALERLSSSGEWVKMSTLMANGLKKDIAFEVMGSLTREGKVVGRTGGNGRGMSWREYTLA